MNTTTRKNGESFVFLSGLQTAFLFLERYKTARSLSLHEFLLQENYAEKFFLIFPDILTEERLELISRNKYSPIVGLDVFITEPY